MNRKLLIAALAGTVFSATAYGQGTMYLLGANRNLYTVDLTTGAQTLVGVIDNGATTVSTAAGLAYNCATQTMYLTSSGNDSLYTLDLTTLASTLVGPYVADVVMHGIEVNSRTGLLYGGDNGDLLSIDAATGAASVIGNAGYGSFLNLGFHHHQNVMYGTNTQTDSWYKIDLATGAGSYIGQLNGPTNPHGVTYVPHLQTMYIVCSSTNGFYSVDVNTGATTLISTFPSSNYLGLAWVPDTCPVDAAIDARVNLAAPPSCLLAQGDQGTFVSTVTNDGTGPVSNATVTFTLPPNSVFVSSTPSATPVGNQVTVNLGTLAPDATASLSVTVVLNDLGFNTGQASVAVTGTDEITSNDLSAASTFVSLGVPATANARALASNIITQANSEVPGLPGVLFSTTGFDRPFRSPNGNSFVITADTNAATAVDEVLLVGNVSTGTITVGAREGDIGPEGAAWGPFDSGLGINDSGHFVFSNNHLGATASDEVIVKWDGTQFVTMVTEGNTVPNTSFAYGTTNSAANILADGGVAFLTNMLGTGGANNDTALFSNSGALLLSQESTSAPSGQVDGIDFTVKAYHSGATDGQGFFISADGAHHLWTGTVNNSATTRDDVVVVDDAVVVQHGVVLNPLVSDSPVSAYHFAHMEGNGDWFVFGSNSNGFDWVLRNGAFVATETQPIATGMTEAWTDVGFTDGFRLAMGSPSGSYVVGGTTDHPDDLYDSVLVLNGTTVVARENDPIDLDNNGIFDDGVYIRDFVPMMGTLTDTHMILLVDVRDADTARGCGTANTDLGQALVSIPLPPTGPLCGTSDFNGDGAPGLDDDIEAFFLCLGGDCCATCWVNGSDFNGDGAPGLDDDIESFFLVLGGGTCI